MEKAIFSGVHNKRFHLAEQAPICSDQLREDFGYLANSKAAEEVLDGTYTFPDYTHQGTKELLEEVEKNHEIFPQNVVNIVMTMENWRRHWKRTNETTSSSPSILHFGHYMAGLDSRLITLFDALKATTADTRGFALERWKSGLTVMLEKKPGATFIDKLQAILLTEADYNKPNKEILELKCWK